jgi:hypothetical protein
LPSLQSRDPLAVLELKAEGAGVVERRRETRAVELFTCHDRLVGRVPIHVGDPRIKDEVSREHVERAPLGWNVGARRRQSVRECVLDRIHRVTADAPLCIAAKVRITESQELIAVDQRLLLGTNFSRDDAWSRPSRREIHSRCRHSQKARQLGRRLFGERIRPA